MTDRLEKIYCRGNAQNTSDQIAEWKPFRCRIVASRSLNERIDGCAEICTENQSKRRVSRNHAFRRQRHDEQDDCDARMGSPCQ